MSEKINFISALDTALSENFHYDYTLDWDKAHHAVTLSFVLEAENLEQIALIDVEGTENNGDLLYEDAVLFYDPVKTKFDESDYLAAIPYDDKGLSKEFIAYFVTFLQDTADEGLSDLMDFLASDDEEEFSIKWNAEAFAAGDEKLIETEFYRYPRY